MAIAAPGPKTIRRLPDGWTSVEPLTFALAPQTPTLGAEVTGVDLREPLAAETLREMWFALLEWKLLIFRSHRLTPAQHVAFALRFGPLFDDSIGVPSKPDPMDNYVEFVREPGMEGLDNVWHTDGSFRPNPPVALTLRAIEVPPVGGDTLFADMAVAYDNLPEDVKARIADLEAINDWAVGYYAQAGFYGERFREIKAGLPDAVHKVARPHPITGRVTLYANRAFTSRLADHDEALFEYLRSQVEIPEYQYRLRWAKDTFVIFDNQALQHYATNNYMPHRRIMGRATIGAWSDEVLAVTR